MLSVFGFGYKDRASVFRSHIFFGGRIWDSGGSPLKKILIIR